MEIGAEIVRHPLARCILVAGLHPVVAVVDAPEVIRQPFAEMPENDLQPRAFVEQSAADQPQGMQRGFGGKAPGRAEQPGMSIIKRAHSRHRRSRMQVERDVEALDHAPERPILRQIVVERRAGAGELAVSVHQRALEAELLDAALELLRRALRVLHRQCGDAGKPVRALCNLLRQNVVGLASELGGPPGIRDTLHCRRIE